MFTGLSIHECPKCGVRHGIPQSLLLQAQENRWDSKHPRWIHCPNGHTWALTGKSDADQLRLERDRLKQRVAESQDDARYQRELREQAEKTASAYKGVATKLKNRAKAGLCPCCNRSFENLRRHMATKHPDFSGDLSGDVATDLRKIRVARGYTQREVAAIAGVRSDQISSFERSRHVEPKAAAKIAGWVSERAA